MSPKTRYTQSAEQRAFTTRFKLRPPGLPLDICRVDPFQSFTHPSMEARDWAWQPLNQWADLWHQCFSSLVDVVRARDSLAGAADSYARYERGLALCTRIDALVELVRLFHKKLSVSAEVLPEELSRLSILTGQLGAKVPAVEYITRMRNKRASHVEVPEMALHSGVLTWKESREAYDGIFDTAALETVAKTLTSYVQDSAVLHIYEWFRFVDPAVFQIWLPWQRGGSSGIPMLTWGMVDRLRKSGGATLSSVTTMLETESLFVATAMDLVVLPTDSTEPAAPRDGAHSVIGTWAIEFLNK